MMNLYTSSRLRVLRSCLRLHLYRYVLGIRGHESPDMLFGTVAHRALEAYLLAWQSGSSGSERLDHALAAVGDLGYFDRAKLRVLLVAYHERWGAEDWQILAVEVEFRYQLGEYLIGGKIDAIIRNRADGRVYVLEHKTTGADASIGSTYWERLAIDTQVSIYVDGATMLGHEIAGCIYDVLKRPAHDQKLATPVESRKYTLGKGCKGCGGSAGGKAGIVQGRGHYDVAFASDVTRVACEQCAGTGWKKDAEGVPEAPRLHSNQRDVDETVDQFEERLTEVIAEAPDAFLLRGVVVRLDDELGPMRTDLLDTIRMERAAALLEVAPRNPDACAKYGRMCDFFDACCGRVSIDDQNRFPRSGAHPELAT